MKERPAGKRGVHVIEQIALNSTVNIDDFMPWQALEDCPAPSLHWAALGWRAGHADGLRDGYHAAERDMAAAWHRIYTEVQATLKREPHHEIVERRDVDHQPCPRGRRSSCLCSHCTHSAAWHRRGCRPYLGVECERHRAAQGGGSQ